MNGIRQSIKAWARLTVPLAMTLAITGCGTGSQSSKLATTSSAQVKINSDEITVNIGVQQSIGALWLAREKGWFEQAFAKVGVKVNWIEFQSGPAYFQAIASDRLDFGAVGNTPVLVGQTAGVDFKEISITGIPKRNDVILVPKGSQIKGLEDLKGKKIAVAKGSSAYNTLFRALEAAGLKASDITIVQLQPNEAEPAFDSHAVDAWSIWEPFVSIETLQHHAIDLTDDAQLSDISPGYNLVRTKFSEAHPDLVVLYLQVLRSAIAWEKQHTDQAVQIFAKARHLDPVVVRSVLDGSGESVDPISPKIMKQQQDTANFLFQNGALGKRIDVSKVVDNRYIEKTRKEPNLKL